MDPIKSAQPDWLGACRHAVVAIREMLAQRSTIAQRVGETGTIGHGGDRTLEIDAAAEAIVFDELARLRAQGHRFHAISEERGSVDFTVPDDGPADAGPVPLVVIDPIDGSLNAKRGVTHHALALAVAHGLTMADVVFGYVYEFGTGEEWRAELHHGAFLNDQPLDTSLEEHRVRDGRLELVAVESVDPRRLQLAADALISHVYRIRVLGAVAPALCQVAAARLDGVVTMRRCRAVDAAAAQLIVREAGGHVSFPHVMPPLGAPLDIAPHSQVFAARSESTLRVLEAACLLP
ncbi:MAG: inositol monophosphatase family protein [Solirubrobacteraceae bacterium]